jgi:uncharacterized protein (DUF1330 family)
MSTPAYILVETKITNPEQYKEYVAQAPACVKEFGGEYMVRGGKHEVLEGNWQPHRLALLKFPSFEQAKAFYDQGGYPAVRKLRLGATEFFNMVLVEGIAAPV